MMFDAKSRLVLGCLALSLLLSSGCGNRYPSSNYGASEGLASRTSPDGIAVFRSICSNRKLPTSTISSLPAVGRVSLSTLVWVPQGFDTCTDNFANWLNLWLESDKKTLVYVGRDYSPSEEYWTISEGLQTSPQAANDVRINAAMERSELNAKLINANGWIAFPWGYFTRNFGPHETINNFQGSWSADLIQTKHIIKLRSGFTSWAHVSDTHLAKFDRDLNEQIDASNNPAGMTAPLNTKPANTPAANPPQPPAKNLPTIPFFDYFERDYIGSSHVKMEKDEREEDEKTRSAKQGKNEPRWNSEVVLATGDNRPLITILTRPKWKGSKIILLANSSLLANFNLVNEGNFRIGERIANEFSLGRVGFLTSDGNPRVRTAEESNNGIASLFTTQLNVLAVHIVLLGILTLVVFWPIFGRPKLLPEASSQNFSQHISALGLLLQRTADQRFAITTISDYFRNVKKDQHSPWATLEPAVSTKAPPFSLTIQAITKSKRPRFEVIHRPFNDSFRGSE